MSSDPEVFVPERYELREAPGRRFAMNRREFLAASGAGLLTALHRQPAGNRPACQPENIEYLITVLNNDIDKAADFVF